jgi:YD repeat-containing protein
VAALVTGASSTLHALEPVIVLALRGDPLPREQVRAALHEELARPVVFEGEAAAQSSSGVVTINYRQGSGELAVTWDSAGRTVSRVIAAAEKTDDVVSDSVLLAGNLARTQFEPPAPLPVSKAPAPPPKTAPPATRVPRHPERPERAREAPPRQLYATASILYPLATHFKHPEATSNLDFNLLYGRVGAVEGLSLGFLNVITRRRDAHMHGLELGVLGNVVRGDLDGFQGAAVFNLVGGSVTGIQLAAGANLSSGNVRGFQGSFALNRAGRLTGAQAGAVNLAGDVDGLQVGLVNVARRVRGVSIGLVNVAEDIDGVPIAPISVTRSGGIHPVVWSGTSGYGNAGLKFATRHTYTLFFAATHHDFGRDFLGGGLAIGGRIPLEAGFHTDVDVCGDWLAAPSLSHDTAEEDSYHEQLVHGRLRLMLAYRIAQHFGVFLGGAATTQLRSELGWDRVTVEVGPELVGGIEL